MSKRNTKTETKEIPIPAKLVTALDPLLREQRRINEQLSAVITTTRIILDVPDTYQLDLVKKAFVPRKEEPDAEPGK